MSTEVPAVEVQRWPQKPGEFLFTRRQGKGNVICGMIHQCPCGCGEPGSITFNIPETSDQPEDKWTWNGSKEKPTLTPSIFKTTGCGWHGYLTNGVFRPC